MNLSKLALARIEKELTQAQVADYVGVDVGTVCRWERGLRQPFPHNASKLLTLFGKSAQDLGLSLSKRAPNIFRPRFPL